MEKQREGRCLCGAVRFTTTGEPGSVALCYCASCRRHSGAPMVAYADFARAQVRFLQGEPARFASSPGVRRGFCAACGSTLCYEGENLPDMIHLHLGAFDDPSDLPPTEVACAEERLSWLPPRGAATVRTKPPKGPA